MKLFNFNDLKVVIEPEVLLLAPFAVIWNRDKTKDKSRAFAELGYVWFMEDFKSDFYNIVNEEERSSEVIKVLALPDGWKPDTKIKEALEFYKKASETTASRLLRDSKSGVEKIAEMLKNPDFNKVDIKKVAETIRMIPQLVSALKALEETVISEKTVIQHRGSQERAMFEDGA